jgi:hypothetical protein
MMRVDLYATVHKALRSRLFDTSVELSRTDFGDPSELRVAISAYRRTFEFLREHHRHEHTFLEPALASHAPAVVRATHEQHDAVEAKMARLDACVGELESSSSPELGRRLVALYEDFLADYLAHMRHEETAMQDAFSKHFTDDELIALRARVQGSIPPPRFGEWLEIMLPAMNLDERAAMLGGMKKAAPPPAFHSAIEIAMRVLGQSGWSAVKSRAQL